MPESETEAPASDKETKRASKSPTGGTLVVVESPAKARTIRKYLGKGFKVKASVGHIKDLPPRKLGVDVEDSFAPEYEVIKGKGKVVEEIRNAAKEVDRVLLAPDPDREGEAIAWHIAEEIRPFNANIERILFNEITKKGVAQGLSAPRPLDRAKFDSQQARRILDRLVGYEISPLLWKTVRRGLSAGRVQSVAVRLIVEREREIEAFLAEEFWTITCTESTRDDVQFDAKLHQIDGQKAKVDNGEQADAIVAALKRAEHRVARVERKRRPRRPPAPFITSKLQQDAARKFRFPAKRTMGLAQRLYEGLDLGGEEGVVGLITYMRTDSTRLSDDAVVEAREFIQGRYGETYLPKTPHKYAAAKRAQDAHEAIRPTHVSLEPEEVKTRLLEQFKPGAKTSKGLSRHEVDDLVRLYGVIWRRFVACQMAAAEYDQTIVDIQATEKYLLRAQGQVLAFPGYTAVYEEGRDENGGNGQKQWGAGGPEKKPLPAKIDDGDPLTLVEVLPEQKFTQPPPRFTEATLVKELEERGIGRPSTYANIISTIQDRKYTEKLEGRFNPTELGTLVNDLLVASFPDVVNVTFTAQMEDRLDKIEDGDQDWVSMLREFYSGFHPLVERAQKEMKRPDDEKTGIACEECGEEMVIKWGRNGKFLACSGFPECRNTKEFRKDDAGKIVVMEAEVTDEVCETCGAPMVHRSGRFGAFLACSKYPECKTTKPISLGVKCPKTDCGGDVVAKRSRRGKAFYGCSNYAKTKCDFVSWDLPVAEACPDCQHPILVRKAGRGGSKLVCPECKFSRSEEETP
ncbi:MAG: type I DNA topoisomerase [bacterium]